MKPSTKLSLLELDILAVVDLGAGTTMRQVAAYLDVQPGECVGPLRRLLDDGYITEERHESGTAYFCKQRGRDLLKRLQHSAPPKCSGNRNERPIIGKSPIASLSGFACPTCGKKYASEGWFKRHTKKCKMEEKAREAVRKATEEAFSTGIVHPMDGCIPLAVEPVAVTVSAPDDGHNKATIIDALVQALTQLQITGGAEIDITIHIRGPKP